MARPSLVLLIALAMVLGACGSTPVASIPTAVPTAVPTAAPTATTTALPSSAPTVAPSAAASPAARTVAQTNRGLGISRAVLQAKFEAAPYNMTFRDAPARDGVPVVRGTSDIAGITIELTGPPENVQEAQVQATVGDKGASSADALRHMLALIEVTSPSISNPTEWLAPHLEKALKDRADITIVGDRMISVITAMEIKYILLSVLPAPR